MSVCKKLANMTMVMVLAVSAAFMIWGCDSDSDDVSTPTTTTASGTEAPAGAYVAETLTDGTTVGTTNDATFTSGGLQLNGGWGFIRYSIPTTTSGYVEFNAIGFTAGEYYGGEEFKSLLVTMWSGDSGYDYSVSPYIFELRKSGYIPEAHFADAVNIRAKVGSSWYDNHQWTQFGWDSSQTYNFRLEWSSGGAVAYRDGAVVATVTFDGDFAPSSHIVQIGANTENPMPGRWKEAPHDIIISDVVIGTL